MKCPYCIKICTKCNKILVAYEGNFSRQKRNGKLKAECKKCFNERVKAYNKKHKEERKEYNKEYYDNHKNELKERNKEYYENHKDKKEEKLKNRREWYKNNKEKEKKYRKQYYNDHKEEIEKHRKEYYEEHKEEIKEYNKEYYKQWKKNNFEKIFNNTQKRRHKLESQGKGITKEQWLEMMLWFDFRCAYSGEYIGGNDNKNRSIDHIIPLDWGGLNEVWNLVPCYNSYNCSKRNKDMLIWYSSQDFFNIGRLNKIYEWCEYAWNKWGYKKRRKGNRRFLWTLE